MSSIPQARSAALRRSLADKYIAADGTDPMRAPVRTPEPPLPPLGPELPAELPPGRVRWSQARKALFQAWGPAALYVAGPKAPVPRRSGDNSLGWPLRIGAMKGKTFGDSITRIMDSYSPYHWQGVWFRVWAPSEEHARRLIWHVVDRLLQEDPETPAGSVKTEIARWVHRTRASRIEGKPSWIEVGPEPEFLPAVRDAAIEAELGLMPLPPRATDEARAERRFKVVREKLARAVREIATGLAIETWDDAGVEAALDRMEAEQARREVEMGRGRG